MLMHAQSLVTCHFHSASTKSENIELSIILRMVQDAKKARGNLQKSTPNPSNIEFMDSNSLYNIYIL